MAEAFARADSMVLHGVRSVSDPSPAEWIGEIRKADDPARWQEMTKAVAQSTPAGASPGTWSLAFVLRKAGQEVALGYCNPDGGELAMRTRREDYARVCAGKGFGQTLLPYGEGHYARRSLSRPPSGATKDASAAAKSVEFALLRSRLLELFEKAEYANLRKPNWPRGVEGVETRGRHAKAWRLMAKGVRDATEGYALTTWPPEVWIWAMTRASPGWADTNDFELMYTNGILYSEDRRLGGMVRTIRPSRQFAEGLRMLVDALEPIALGGTGAHEPGERRSEDDRK